MRTVLFSFVGLSLLASTAQSTPPVMAVSVECNWGKLTMEAINNGFDQGAHSSDPSGDGHGRDTLDEPRAGLGNVVETGNLQATCELIEDLLNP